MGVEREVVRVRFGGVVRMCDEKGEVRDGCDEMGRVQVGQ